MGNPTISVVVPVYNTEKYIEQCVTSIMNQTFCDIEIICVNDGSTDSSYAILQRLAECDSRIVLINRQKASGSAAMPRNMGLEAATGKYIIFLDSDDYFDERMLEVLFNQALRNNADLVMCDNYIVYEKSGEISEEGTELRKEYLPDKETFSYHDIPETIFQISTAAVWDKLILRELLVREGLTYQLNVPIVDDIYFVNLLLILAKRICVIKDRLIYYRACRPGAQTTIIQNHKEAVVLPFLALNQYLRKHGIYDEVRVSLQNWTIAILIWWIQSISDYKVYADLFTLYKDEYFQQLNLDDLDLDEIYFSNFKDFYISVTNGKMKPSLVMLLDFILPPRSNLVIYGAGMVGKNIYQIVKGYEKHNIILWCDKKAALLKDPLIKTPDVILRVNYDALIIAIGKPEIVKEVKTYLTTIGVDDNKIYTV